MKNISILLMSIGGIMLALGFSATHFFTIPKTVLADDLISNAFLFAIILIPLGVFLRFLVSFTSSQNSLTPADLEANFKFWKIAVIVGIVIWFLSLPSSGVFLFGLIIPIFGVLLFLGYISFVPISIISLVLSRKKKKEGNLARAIFFLKLPFFLFPVHLVMLLAAYNTLMVLLG